MEKIDSCPKDTGTKLSELPMAQSGTILSLTQGPLYSSTNLSSRTLTKYYIKSKNNFM